MQNNDFALHNIDNGFYINIVVIIGSSNVNIMDMVNIIIITIEIESTGTPDIYK